MRFAHALPLSLLLLLTASVASAQKAIDITPDYIAGVHLGMTQAKARSLLEKPARLDHLEGGYDRLVSQRQKVEVYFRKGAGGVVVVTTWSKVLATEEGIAPCSTVATLKAAYGPKLKPFRQGGKTVAYTFGRLIFTAEGGRRIGVVALGGGEAAVYVALNAPECT